MNTDLGGTRERVSSYFNVIGGKCCQKITEQQYEALKADNNPKAKKSVSEKDGVTRVSYMIVDDYVQGVLKKAELQEPPKGKEDWGSRVALTMVHPTGVEFVLQFKFDSYYGRAFMYAFPNVDLKENLEIEPYQYEQKGTGKKKTGMSLLQHGSELDWAYGTRDNMGGMPYLEEVTFKGKTQLDNTAQLEFLTEKFKEVQAQINASQVDSQEDPTRISPQDAVNLLSNDADEEEDVLF